MPDPTTVVAEPNMTIPVVTPAVPAADAPVEIKLGDKTLKVSKEVADSITALQTSASEQAAAAAVLKTKLAAAEAARAPAAPVVDPAVEDAKQYDRLFSDPKGFLTDFGNKIKTELRAEYTQTTGQREFWTNFYEKHADLKPHDFYVKAVLDRELPSYESLKVSDVIAKLGETVKKELLVLSGKQPTPPVKPAAEGGTERLNLVSNPGSEHLPTEAPTSITALLRQRRENRRKAGQPQASA